MKCVQQENNIDCGCFVVHFIELILQADCVMENVNLFVPCDSLRIRKSILKLEEMNPSFENLELPPTPVPVFPPKPKRLTILADSHGRDCGSTWLIKNLRLKW